MIDNQTLTRDQALIWLVIAMGDQVANLQRALYAARAEDRPKAGR